MARDNKGAGTRRENQVKDLREAEGWVVTRSPGSLGPADLVCLKAGETPLLEQVKATTGSPWQGFGPKERSELSATAKRAGAVALLCHWPPYGKPKWYGEDQWP